MKRILLIMFSFIILSLTVETPINAVSDALNADQQIKIYKELKENFEDEDHVDLSRIKALYEEQLKAEVIARNKQIDEEISKYVDAAIQKELSVDKVEQAILKGLEWYFYEEIRHLVDVIADEAIKSNDKDTAKAALEQAIALYTGSISQTADELDEEAHTTIEKMLNTVIISAFRQSINEGDITNFGIYRQIFDKTLLKIFLLETVKYAEATEEAFITGEDTCEAQIAGLFSFKPIYSEMHNGSATAADAVIEAFSQKGGAEITKELISMNFAESIGLQMNSKMNSVFYDHLENISHNQILEDVAASTSFAAALETIIKERYGTDVYNKVLTHSEAYLNGIRSQETDIAKKHAFKLLEFIAKVKGITFTIGEKAVTINGQNVSFDTEVSYLDQASNRVLTSVRLIGEALGAKVNFDAQSGTITIINGTQQMILKKGSRHIYLNGKKADLELEQEVVIKNNRAYLPLRASAELIGHRVFWYAGHVIIN
jgi:hypothetical protein